MRRFLDRREAGRELAAELRDQAPKRPVVVALPRGGVPVGYEVARALCAPLDVRIVRKLGLPWHPVLGVGAVAEGGYLHVNHDIVEQAELPATDLEDLVQTERQAVEERQRALRGDRGKLALLDRTVILVDDGIATSGTIHAAIAAVRAERPRAIVLAVPVAPSSVLGEVSTEVDHVVCLRMPHSLWTVGAWYDDFSRVDDEEVTHLLQRARRDETAEHALAE